jgi:hypothetical protein
MTEEQLLRGLESMTPSDTSASSRGEREGRDERDRRR